VFLSLFEAEGPLVGYRIAVCLVSIWESRLVDSCSPSAVDMAVNFQFNPDFQKVGTEFVQHYYTTFAQSRESLTGLYCDQSVMTWEDKQIQGAQQIMAKLNSLARKVSHNIVMCDCQPTPNLGVLVLVTGDITIEDNQPIKFCQVFNLVPGAQGFVIFNELFRLNIG